MIKFVKDIHQQMSASVTDRTMRNTVIPVVCSFALCYTKTKTGQKIQRFMQTTPTVSISIFQVSPCQWLTRRV